MKNAVWMICLATIAAMNLAAAEAAELPSYKPVAGVSGTIKSVGSDTMNNLMALWAEGFQKHYPSVKIEVEGKGTATAPPALIEGTASFGPMSRPMKKQEIDEFEKKFGYKPVALGTAVDALAVFVHKDNPIKGLSLPQVDAIFSKTRKLGIAGDITIWGQLGLTGDYASANISLFGRNSASGTYGFFKEHALGKGDFKDSVKEQAGSSAVVQGVASDKLAIGYSGIGYATPDVRAVPLKVDNTSDLVEANQANALSGDYPLARTLYMYINHKPGSEMDPLRREFIKYIFSKEGQAIVAKDGYYPVPPSAIKKYLAACGISE